jgi:tetratricopeptide (TPR) repeat protein
MEDTSEKAAVTPGRILPARELLGDMLLESGHPADALAAYEAALVTDPKRLRSFDGAARAALAAGDPDKAHDYCARLVAMVDSTSTRAELIKARAYLASK